MHLASVQRGSDLDWMYRILSPGKALALRSSTLLDIANPVPRDERAAGEFLSRRQRSTSLSGSKVRLRNSTTIIVGTVLFGLLRPSAGWLSWWVCGTGIRPHWADRVRVLCFAAWGLGCNVPAAAT